MNRTERKASVAMLVTAAGLMAGLWVFGGTAPAGAFAAEEKNKTTDTDTISVVFTHDMHSHMDADKTEKDGKIVSTGGFGRLKTAMEQVKQRYPDSFVLDAGDFSMGTPYQTIFSQQAPELNMMAYLGFEATTFGNHEFDYRATGLASMLKAAGKGPQLVAANIDWDATLAEESLRENGAILKEACDAYGVKDYTVIDHDGVKAAVFGLMGESAVEYAPESGLLFKDAAETAAEVVQQIEKEEDVDVIICLSHCGTIENEEDEMEKSEDYRLAQQVPQIDLIISGHSHTRLEEPVTVGATQIVSCGCYNASLGHILLKKEGAVQTGTAESGGESRRYGLEAYQLIALDESIEEDEAVKRELTKYKEMVDESYFNSYGYDVEQIIAENHVDFPAIEEFGLKQGEQPLGNLIADSYKYAVAQAENGSIRGYEQGGVASGEVSTDEGGAQIAIVPHGVIRGSFFRGQVSVADAFNVSSLGYGKDGLSGYPLVRAYLTGKELKAVAEVDASISDFMGVARLYSSGLEYSWNSGRLILNRAVDVAYNDGERIADLEDDTLYSVVADLYSCQMLGAVKDQSFGLLEIEPKDRNGDPISDFEAHIIYDGDREVKAWYALASYIDSFENDSIPAYYGQLQGRKTEIDSNSPAELLRQPNKISGMAAAVCIGLIAVVVGIVVLVRKRRRKRGAG